MIIVPFFLIIFTLLIIVNILGFVFWVWTIIDCATNEPSEGNDKIIWILIIIFTNWLGALIYFLVRRPTRIKELGK